jgi:hypothetical protein
MHLYVSQIRRREILTSRIQNVGHVRVDGVENVDRTGLGILTLKLNGNFQIRFARNARTVVHGRHQTFPVGKIATQRNVNVRKRRTLSAFSNGCQVELFNIWANSKWGLAVIVGKQFNSQAVIAKPPKMGLLEMKLFVVKTKVQVPDAMILENILILIVAKVVGARSNLFI